MIDFDSSNCILIESLNRSDGEILDIKIDENSLLTLTPKNVASAADSFAENYSLANIRLQGLIQPSSSINNNSYLCDEFFVGVSRNISISTLHLYECRLDHQLVQMLMHDLFNLKLLVAEACEQT